MKKPIRHQVVKFVGVLVLAGASDHAAAASFDCSKASSATETMICEDNELSAADEQLAKAYALALKTAPSPDAVKAEQRAWVKNERSKCSDAPCLLKAYQERLSSLSPASEEASISPESDPKSAGQEPQEDAAPLNARGVDQGEKAVPVQAVSNSEAGAASFNLEECRAKASGDAAALDVCMQKSKGVDAKEQDVTGAAQPAGAAIVQGLRDKYAATRSEFPAGGFEDEPSWSVASKSDPMSDVKSVEAVSKIRLNEQRNVFELKLVCTSDVTKLIVSSAPDSFRREPAPAGNLFLSGTRLIYYAIRFGERPAITKFRSDSATKFLNVLDMSFPVEAFIPSPIKTVRASNPNLDLAIGEGFIKADTLYAGTLDDIVGSTVVRLKFSMANSDDQVVSIYPGTPGLKPFFSECFALTEKSAWLNIMGGK